MNFASFETNCNAMQHIVFEWFEIKCGPKSMKHPVFGTGKKLPSPLKLPFKFCQDENNNDIMEKKQWHAITIFTPLTPMFLDDYSLGLCSVQYEILKPPRLICVRFAENILSIVRISCNILRLKDKTPIKWS